MSRLHRLLTVQLTTSQRTLADDDMSLMLHVQMHISCPTLILKAISSVHSSMQI